MELRERYFRNTFCTGQECLAVTGIIKNSLLEGEVYNADCFSLKFRKPDIFIVKTFYRVDKKLRVVIVFMDLQGKVNKVNFQKM